MPWALMSKKCAPKIRRYICHWLLQHFHFEYSICLIVELHFKLIFNYAVVIGCCTMILTYCQNPFRHSCWFLLLFWTCFLSQLLGCCPTSASCLQCSAFIIFCCLLLLLHSTCHWFFCCILLCCCCFRGLLRWNYRCAVPIYWASEMSVTALARVHLVSRLWEI